MRNLMLAAVLILVFATGAGAYEPVHVTYLWHMHQPIYYPYESPGTIDANGRFNFSVQGVWDGDRIGCYQSWPRDAVQSASDKGISHGGAQMSYSGSLAENNNSLWGYCTGSAWDDSVDWARNGLRTSLNNPRLDTVGIAYHHSLMPLTCRESMKMQIRLHKEQFKQLWDTTGYSKGFWPPECAFAEWMIPALVEEGLEWVIVDNGHLFRAVPDFPWSDASSCRPNPAEIQNPSSTELGSSWVQLPNVWAPTKVLAPWAYQPHNVQWIDPNSGTAQKIVAVPAGRYEGNENGRGGYGAFKPENVWLHDTVAAVNNDASHPMLLLCHSDGDNYGMKNSDAWHGQNDLFLEMCKANYDFEFTSVQDYLDMYPPNVNDIIHVEPGSWIGIDGGTPYFEKWLSSTYVSGENPDRWSWSVLVAAQNRVILADSLENSYLTNSAMNMDDVEWGINNDTAKAWHWYLVGETSCYWYWDLDRANPWDGNVTRACNAAIPFAQAVIDRHPGVDTKGPSIFAPQRSPYNPGGYMWNETTPASSDFEVWSYVDDYSGLSDVRLYYRADNDGVNPISSVQNETYAGGAEVGSWSILGMTNSWDPTVKGPDNIVPSPTARAQRYGAQVTGQSDVLIDYFIEAVDSKGNTNRSDMMHVYVGQFNSSNAVPVTFSPSLPDNCDGSKLTITYNSAGRSLSAASPVTLMINYSTESATNEYAMSGSAGGLWYYTSSIPSGATSAKVMFRDGATYDNNSGSGWTKSISDCAVPASVNFNPPNPDGCDAVEIIYHAGDGALGSATQVFIHVGCNDWQGVPNPDPAMTKSGTNWTYTYSPPAGAYEIDCVFNNGAGTWDNNSGSDYKVTVSNCNEESAAVVFSPGTPTDCDGATLSVAYNPTNRVLQDATNVHIYIQRNGGIWQTFLMAEETNVWTYDTLPGVGTTNISVMFGSNNLAYPPADDNGGDGWAVAVSSCQTSGPSAVVFYPASPSGCDPVLITYYPNQGVLKGAAQVNIHIGRNGWKDVSDVPMAPSGGAWVWTNDVAEGTYQINCCFNNGSDTWDSNNGADWSVSVTGCTGAVPSGITFVEGSPAITDDNATNQNDIGDAFDMNQSGGSAVTLDQGGFGSFGQVYVNFDDNNLYIGAHGADMVGDNNGMVIFLELNTLSDNANNVWNLYGDPQGLELLHNVWLEPAMDIAIVLGDEYGDGTYSSFNLGNGYNYGQGVYYLSGSSSSFWPVAGAKLSQYDGTGTVAVVSADDDGNRPMDRWECSIPWSSLNSTNGIAGITNCWIAGVIASDGTNGSDRYISGNILGTANPVSGNYEFGFVNLTGTQVRLPVADSDGDGIPDNWEWAYDSSLGYFSAFSDRDGDGVCDGDEYLAATHPKDDESFFHLYQPAVPGDVLVHWHSVSNMQYDLFRSTSLLLPDWVQIGTNIPGAPPMNTYTDNVEDAETLFYRVRTER
ncbi:MAG: hypothetical protein AB7T27_07455 [Kiritimatiellia bacterium]